MLEELAKFHIEWVRIANSFLGNEQDAEDIIQEMYLKLHRCGVELNKIRYKNGINKYFIYMTIRNLCLSFLKKTSEGSVKNNGLNIVNLIEEVDEKWRYNSLAVEEEPENNKALDTLLEKINKEINTWHSYDRVLFECKMYSGLSFRDMAYGTDKKARLISNQKALSDGSVKNGNGISVSSMFNTIKNCKHKLKQKLGKDFENYFNNEFDKIT